MLPGLVCAQPVVRHVPSKENALLALRTALLLRSERLSAPSAPCTSTQVKLSWSLSTLYHRTNFGIINLY